MSNVVDWAEIGDNPKGGALSGAQGQISFLRLQSGNTYKIRLLGSPVKFYKYVIQHDGSWRSAICEDPSTCIIRQEHGEDPRERYAVNVIDRTDGEIKIMEGPLTVFKTFRTFFEGTGSAPGGAQGGDFEIVVTGSGLGTRYKVTFSKKTPFTDEEKTYIKEKGLYELERIFKSTPPDEIEATLYGPKDGQSNSQHSGQRSQTSNQTVDEDAGASPDPNDDSDLPW